jgi:hypothetical protein
MGCNSQEENLGDEIRRSVHGLGIELVRCMLISIDLCFVPQLHSGVAMQVMGINAIDLLWSAVNRNEQRNNHTLVKAASMKGSQS